MKVNVNGRRDEGSISGASTAAIARPDTGRPIHPV
jgi:hypothetical protein